MFADCLLVPPKDAMHPDFAEKAFTNSHKTSKFMKFSPSKVSHHKYTMEQGSRFSRTVPLKRNGSWGITAITDLGKQENLATHLCIDPGDMVHLSFSSEREATSTPSINTDPSCSSTMRNKAWNKLDLPAPVLPTTPIWMKIVYTE